jgi:type II secretory pathway component PulJ
MKRHVAFSAAPLGFTLIEVLIATTLSLMMMVAVITMFSRVTSSISKSRAGVEAADRLRLAASRLQQDLAGVTVDMSKVWHRPEDNEGYLEYIEGPVTQTTASTYAVNTDASNAADTTVGDFDDILIFTTRSTGRPFIGKVPTTINSSGAIQSDVAEVAWFIRGRTLYRRMLLVKPSAPIGAAVLATGFYKDYDLSAHAIYDQSTSLKYAVLNTLGDLTKRENRFAHLTQFGNSSGTYKAAFPFNASLWCWQCTSGATTITIPTLPTLRECSSASWTIEPMESPTIPTTVPLSATPNVTNLDFWTNAASHRVSDNSLSSSTDGTRIADDVILTNVIGFDVKAWDPVANGYVDLGYGGVSASSSNINSLAHYGAVGYESTGLVGTSSTARIYDTWPTHYESQGISSTDTNAGRALNGLDDDGNGIVDDAGEFLTSPPYPIALRGIQIKIRTFEPDSRQVREVTVVQDFLPK